MTAFWQTFKRGIYAERYWFAAFGITLVCWLVFAHLVVAYLGEHWLNLILAVLAGYYWLGRAVIPWIENKLKS